MMRKETIRHEYYHANVHIIFDINMDGKFTRKEILVDNNHTTSPLSLITYLSVVSRDSFRIAFLLKSLNKL